MVTADLADLFERNKALLEIKLATIAMYIFLSFRRISIIPEKCSWVDKFKNNLDYNGKK